MSTLHPVPKPVDPPASGPVVSSPGSTFLPPIPVEDRSTEPYRSPKSRWTDQISSVVDRFFAWIEARLLFMSSLLYRILRLDIYGDSLKTPRVETELVVFASVLLFQFGVDLWAWHNTWSICLPDSGIPIPGTEEWVEVSRTETGTQMTSKYLVLNIAPIILAFIFSLAIMLVDRSIIVSDTTVRKPVDANGGLFKLSPGTKSLMARIGLIFLISTVTAVPVELRIFSQEISNRIAAEEKKAVDRIRDDGIRTERERSEKATTAIRESSERDLEALRKEQEIKRTQLKETIDKERQPFAEDVARFKQQAALEAVGTGRSRIAGAGPIYKELLHQSEIADARLDAFNDKARERTDRLNEQLDIQRLRKEGERDAKLEKEENALSQKIEKIRTGSPDEIAALYGGTWRQPNGFLARYASLQVITSENWTQRTIAWGCRIVLILFGLIVLVLKLMASEEFKRYCSFAAQVTARQPHALAMANGMGYVLPDQYGLDAAPRNELHAHTVLMLEISAILDAFQQNVFVTCQRGPGEKHCKPHNQVVSALNKYWIEEVQPKLDALTRHEHAMRLSGISIPSWPPYINKGQDPRTRKTPWNLGVQELEEHYGWENPKEAVKYIRDALSRIPVLQSNLQTALTHFRSHEINLVVGNPLLTPMNLISERSKYWREVIQPILNELAVLENSLGSFGTPVPNWPKGFPDPRDGLEESFYRLDYDRLSQLDWRGGVFIKKDPR